MDTDHLSQWQDALHALAAELAGVASLMHDEQERLESSAALSYAMLLVAEARSKALALAHEINLPVPVRSCEEC